MGGGSSVTGESVPGGEMRGSLYGVEHFTEMSDRSTSVTCELEWDSADFGCE